MLKKHGKTNKLSQPIVFLAVIGIALGIAVMLISSAVATGFQKEIREKVVGFGGHIQIESQFGNESYESNPMLIPYNLKNELEKDSKVRLTQNYAYKPAILQSKNGEKFNNKGEIIRDIEGIVFKAVDHNFDASFFTKHLKAGYFPSYKLTQSSDSIVVSNYIANRLNLSINEKVSTFFVKEKGPKQRNLIIAGIFETGLEEFDKRFGFIDLNQLRKINSWGIQTYLAVVPTLNENRLTIKASCFGGNDNYKYSWNNGPFTNSSEFSTPLLKDTSIVVVSSDFEKGFPFGETKMISVPDTAILDLKFQKKNKPSTDCKKLSKKIITQNEIIFENDCFLLETKLKTSIGSGRFYTGGIEVLLNSYQDLFKGENIVKELVGPEFRTSTIVERNQEIFNWLDMLDLNVFIIIGLMILVAIINMTAALLVIILEKTQMIGILKSLGANNWSIRKIFILNGGYLILTGLLIGNAIGLSIIFLQSNFELITLPKENYFVSIVPMHLSLINVLAINFGSLAMCIASLVIPSYFITKIAPIKAIKKD